MEHYISQQKSQLLDSLENQVRFSQLVAVVVGDKGVGKSFLLMELQSRLEEEVLVARVDASLAMTEDQLEKTISLQLGLSWQDSEVRLEQRIKNDLTQKVLITIDDAHQLSNSCLNFILMLNQNQLEFRESVIFILLAGDNSLPALIKITDTYSLHQDMCVVFRVEPIEQNETQALIGEMDPDPIISAKGLYEEKKLDYFWQLSKGNPAELNYHVSRWLAEQSSSEPDEILTDEPVSYFRSFLYFLAAIVLMSVLIFQDEINQLISSSNSTSQNQKLKAGKDTELETLRPESDSTRLKSQNLTPPSSKQKTLAGSYKENQKEAEEITDTKNETLTPKKDTGKANLEPASTLDVNADTELDAKTTQNKINADLTANVTADQIKPIKDHTLIVEMSYLTEDEQELLLLADNRYLFQWLALSELNAAMDYVEKHKLRDEMKVYRRVQSGSVLFLIVSGDFATRADALATLEIARSSGIVEKPWVKSIKAVKNEIKAFQTANR